MEELSEEEMKGTIGGACKLNGKSGYVYAFIEEQTGIRNYRCFKMEVNKPYLQSVDVYINDKKIPYFLNQRIGNKFQVLEYKTLVCEIRCARKYWYIKVNPTYLNNNNKINLKLNFEFMEHDSPTKMTLPVEFK